MTILDLETLEAKLSSWNEKKYNEYTRSIFKTYLISNNEAFKDAIKVKIGCGRKESSQ